MRHGAEKPQIMTTSRMLTLAEAAEAHAREEAGLHFGKLVLDCG